MQFTFRVKMNDMGESEIYQFIKLTTSKCPFVVARLNPEIVRGLWASTIHEVMFAGNSENERGSLQVSVPLSPLPPVTCPHFVPFFAHGREKYDIPHIPEHASGATKFDHNLSGPSFWVPHLRIALGDCFLVISGKG